MDKEKVREQAKKIMDEFVEALDRAEETFEFGELRESNIRGKSVKRDEPEFRAAMFQNAPKKNEEYIIAEKKKW